MTGDRRGGFLLEILSEEIPAGLQRQAAETLCKRITDHLPQGINADYYYGARRLAVACSNLPLALPGSTQERKGPRVDAPAAAVAGFERSTPAPEWRHEVRGGVIFAVRELAPQPMAEVLTQAVTQAVENFPWIKSMRWGSGDFRWIRPLRNIMCLFEGEVLPVSFGGLSAVGHTYGHRFMAPGAIDFTGVPASDYTQAYQRLLAENNVLLDGNNTSARTQAIADGLAQECAKAGLSLVPDQGLLQEVTGLVEWPVVLLGAIAPEYGKLPPELLQTALRVHQKFFSATDNAGRVAAFLTVANIAAPEGGAAIIAGNQRVLAARLSDARYFWENDLKRTPKELFNALAAVQYHEGLGALQERAKRLALTKFPGLDDATRDLLYTAAENCKNDLVTGTVGEFPELQGIIGGYHAAAHGKSTAVAKAIKEHYRPQGASDAIPASYLGRLLALLDKVDRLAGFFSINELPTSSKDPYALRRAALGIIRIAVEGGVKFNLTQLIANAVQAQPGTAVQEEGVLDAVTAFIRDRFRVYLLDKQYDAATVDAALSWPGCPATQYEAATALQDAGERLAPIKRACGILAAAEAAEGVVLYNDEMPTVDNYALPQERALHAALSAVGPLDPGNPAAVIAALGDLRAPVDAFFAAAMINDPDPEVRTRRLLLLNAVRGLWPLRS